MTTICQTLSSELSFCTRDEYGQFLLALKQVHDQIGEPLVELAEVGDSRVLKALTLGKPKDASELCSRIDSLGSQVLYGYAAAALLVQPLIRDSLLPHAAKWLNQRVIGNKPLDFSFLQVGARVNLIMNTATTTKLPLMEEGVRQALFQKADYLGRELLGYIDQSYRSYYPVNEEVVAGQYLFKKLLTCYGNHRAHDRELVLNERNVYEIYHPEVYLVRAGVNIKRVSWSDITTDPTAITDAIVRGLLQSLPWLESLNLEGCYYVTDSAFESESHSKLTRVNVSGTSIQSNLSRTNFPALRQVVNYDACFIS